MTDKKKIEVLRKEIESYRQRLEAADKENKRLSNRLSETFKAEEETAVFHENAVQEYAKLKEEYSVCIDELYGYKKKYLDLLEETAKLKQHYKKEFDSLMKIIGRNENRG